MANQTRAWPSWKTRMDEIMPSMAPIRTISSTQRRLLPPGMSERRFSALTTGAPSPMIDCHGTMPLRTMATPPYRRVQATSVARMPKGKSRCGRLHSSAAVETESKPM